MHASFKVKIYSGDGQTFIANDVFNVPCTTTNGTSQSTETWSFGKQADDAFPQVINALLAKPYCQVFFDSECTYISGGESARLGSFNYANHLIVVPDFFGGSSISVGSAKRIVFNNGNYLKLEVRSVSYYQPTDAYTVTIRIYYYLSNDQSLGSIDLQGSWDGLLGRGVSLKCIPFALPGTDGHFHNTKARGYGYNDISRSTAFTIAYDPTSGSSANAAVFSNMLFPYETSIELYSFVEGLRPIDVDNPYDEGGVSEESDSTGNFSDDSDTVSEDTMPILSAVDTGFATIFTPGSLQLKALADVFWSQNLLTLLQNTAEKISDMFVSLGIVPFYVTPGRTVEVTWMGWAITEVMLTLAGWQYKEFDLGTIDLADDPRIFTSGSALDYSPFSKLGIYLPFIGFQELDIDECRGATVQLLYRVDIMSGSCVAIVKINGNSLYQFTGNCMTQIPITSESFENLFTNVVQVGLAASNAKVAGAVAGGGDSVTSEQWDADKITESQAQAQLNQHKAIRSHAQASLGNATANAMMGLKPNYNKTGSLSASNSLMCVKQPYLFLTTPRQCMPSYYQKYAGFPANITDTLGNFSGFTVVSEIRLNGLVATSPEVAEINELLHSGVII